MRWSVVTEAVRDVTKDVVGDNVTAGIIGGTALGSTLGSTVGGVTAGGNKVMHQGDVARTEAHDAIRARTDLEAAVRRRQEGDLMGAAAAAQRLGNVARNPYARIARAPVSPTMALGFDSGSAVSTLLGGS